MADKLIYIPNDDIQNYPFCRLQLVAETFENSRKWTNKSKFILVPKVVMPTNEKRNYNILGRSVKNSPMSPPSLDKIRCSHQLRKYAGM